MQWQPWSTWLAHMSLDLATQQSAKTPNLTQGLLCCDSHWALTHPTERSGGHFNYCCPRRIRSFLSLCPVVGLRHCSQVTECSRLCEAPGGYAVTRGLARARNHSVKHLPCNHEDPSLIPPEPTWRKERSKSHMLWPDFYMHTVACAHIHTKYMFYN